MVPPGEAVSESFRKKSKAQGGANLCTPAPDKGRRPQKNEGSGGGGMPYFVGYGICEFSLPHCVLWAFVHVGTALRPGHLTETYPSFSLFSCPITESSSLRSTLVPSPCLGLREPCLGKGRRVRAARMEEGPGERKSVSGHSSSVCEVTERLPGWSPAFPLEIPGLHSRKEPALFTTWPEPSPALSLALPRPGWGRQAWIPPLQGHISLALSALLMTTCARLEWPSRRSAPSSIRPTASVH